MIFDLNKQDVFIMSDSHFGHVNLCRGTTSWKLEDIDPNHTGVRDFYTLEEMNQAIVDGINNNIKEDDILVHLGDWSFGGIENIWNFRKQIKCKNIYLTYGNHDSHILNNKLIPLEEPIEILNAKNKVNAVFAKSLFTYTDHILDFKVKFNKKDKAKRFFCSHYAHRVWPDHHQGVFCCYGHSHSGLEGTPWGKSMDVGLDNAFKLLGEYRPFNIREVFEILDKREIHKVDHHVKGIS